MGVGPLLSPKRVTVALLAFEVANVLNLEIEVLECLRVLGDIVNASLACEFITSRPAPSI